MSDHEIRLFDSQWVNIVNHDNCYEGYTLADAVSLAVHLTEAAMAENHKSNDWPVKPY